MYHEVALRREFARTGHLEAYRRLREDNRLGRATLEDQLDAYLQGKPFRSNRPQQGWPTVLLVLENLDRSMKVASYNLLLQLCRVVLDTSGIRLFQDTRFVYALAHLARFHSRVIREPESWRGSRSRHPQQVLRSLLRHLFTRYAVPAFLERGAVHQDEASTELFISLSQGAPIYGNPLLKQWQLSRRAAHKLVLAPPQMGLSEAVRWAQATALEADRRMARILATTPALRNSGSGEEAFWQSCMAWLARYPELNRSQVKAVLAWIRLRRFGIATVGMQDLQIQDPEPGFSLRKRSLAKVLEAAERWQNNAGRLGQHGSTGWAPMPLPDVETILDGRPAQVIQLVRARDLVAEGHHMKHCVATYLDHCQEGRSSIWSLRQEGAANGGRRCTLELDNKKKLLLQARGRCNRYPSNAEIAAIGIWAEANGIAIYEHSFC